jgi:hypothetical protein
MFDCVGYIGLTLVSCVSFTLAVAMDQTYIQRPAKVRLELVRKLNERLRNVQKQRKQRERLRKMVKDLETTEAQIQLVDENIKRLESMIEEGTDGEDE